MRLNDVRMREMITIMADTPVDKIAGWLTEHRIGGISLVNDEIQDTGIVLGLHENVLARREA
jgi:predicted transcriptional regulator